MLIIRAGREEPSTGIVDSIVLGDGHGNSNGAGPYDLRREDQTLLPNYNRLGWPYYHGRGPDLQQSNGYGDG